MFIPVCDSLLIHQQFSNSVCTPVSNDFVFAVMFRERVTVHWRRVGAVSVPSVGLVLTSQQNGREIHTSCSLTKLPHTHTTNSACTGNTSRVVVYLKNVWCTICWTCLTCLLYSCECGSSKLVIFYGCGSLLNKIHISLLSIWNLIFPYFMTFIFINRYYDSPFMFVIWDLEISNQ